MNRAGAPSVPGPAAGALRSVRHPSGHGLLAGASFAAAMPLLYVYMPRPPVSGAHLLVYPAVAAVLIALSMVIVGKHRVLDGRIGVLTSLLVLSAVAAASSSIVNAPVLRSTAPLETVRPFLFGVFLVYGYYVGLFAGSTAARKGLLWASYLILAGQLVIAATQVLGIPVFDLVYADDKSRPLGSLLRVTGSVGNPNIFAWIVAQMSVLVLLLSTSWTRYLWLILGALLVLLAGSRTLLALFPVMVAFSSVLGPSPHGERGGISWKALFASAGIATAFLFVIMSLAAYFPYLGQLQSVITTGSLGSVNAFAARLAMWGRAYTEFTNASDVALWLGLGSREATRVLDNDTLYVFFRGGVVGLLVHFGILAYCATIFLRARRSVIAFGGLQYLFFALVLGLVADTLGGWLTPLFLFYLAGIVIGLDAPGEMEHLGMAGRDALR